MKKQITINKKVYDVAFNFAVICKYEETTGEPFDVTKLDDARKKASLNLIWSVLAANNADVPAFSDFIRDLSVREYQEATDAVARCMVDFYRPIEAEQKTDDSEDTEAARQDP